ncbi:MAG: hypothetical protein L0312_20160 [Acidobacteria bacterium]|nr:hypothetical protein [Acidobacteriota bacterium]
MRRRRRHRERGAVAPEIMAGWTEVERRAYAEKQVRQLPVAEIGLAVRTVNVLEDENIILLDDLLKQSRDRLLKVPNFGEKTLVEIRQRVKNLGLVVPTDWRRLPRRKQRSPKRKRGTKDEPGGHPQ